MAASVLPLSVSAQSSPPDTFTLSVGRRVVNYSSIESGNSGRVCPPSTMIV
jgi:hypothetical protein